MKVYNIANGVNMYYLKDEKYKTASICISLKNQLKRENVTQNALLAKVLRRGTQKLNSIEKINPYLEELFGARFDVFSTKKSNLMFLNCAVTAISNRYTGEDCVLKTAQLMLDFIYEPYMPNGKLCEEYVKSEKINLKDDIEAIINDKRTYATQRCVDIMCEGENASIHDGGYVEDLDLINAENLTEYYCNIVKNCPVDIFVLGSCEPDAIHEMLKEYFKDFAPNQNAQIELTANSVCGEVKNISEAMDVNQGKLSIGLRTSTLATDFDYYHLLVANSILGSGAHSKLFCNVREKLSLCYYVYSRIDKLSGLMLIGAGIEFDKFEETKSAIFEQIKAVKEGNFTTAELDISKKFLVNNLKTQNDSQFAMRDFYYTNMLCGINATVDDVINSILSVTKDDVINVFKKLEYDTVYFLKGRE